MERHKCKLCLKSFVNGRALGGHMRSHMLNISSKPEEDDEEEEEEYERASQISEETESASSSSSSDEEEVEEDDDDDDEKEKDDQFYGLRENPKRSIRMADPEFSFAVDPGSVVLQDRESETESSKINLTWKRSKRTRKHCESGNLYKDHQQRQDEVKKLKLSQLVSRTDTWTEPEPLSSISDTTTEEDLAFCLMMLSRDKWKKKKERHEEEDQERENDTDESDGFKSKRNRTRGKYKCETCNKVFKSYQALGGHRASHKKNKVCRPEHLHKTEQENAGAEKKIHECPVCFRVFSSGQALGGHKRSHGIGGLTEAPVACKTPVKQRLIDLNLPAPVDEDDTSQIEGSIVFDEC